MNKPITRSMEAEIVEMKGCTGPPHKNYRLVFEDDFNGMALNEEEWHYRVGERLGGINLAENVRVENGRLVVRFNKEEINGELRYTGGGIISKKLFGYGYYEAKGKLWGGCGWLHSSFWVLGGNGDGVNSPLNNTIIEIDGYEVDSGTPSSIGLNVHYYVGTLKTVGGVIGTKEYKTIETSKEEFVIGFEWLPNQINWYLNGELIRCLKNPLFYGPQNVFLTALGCEAFDRNIDVSKLPGESSWDYFRFYNIDLLGVNMVVNPSFEFNKNKSFEASHIRNMGVPVGWYKEGKTPDAAFVNETEEAYSGECVLRHDSASPFNVTTMLKIPFLPNRMYTLSAMVRNPEGGNHTMRVYGFGGESIYMDIPKTDKSMWSQITIDNIKVSNGECSIAFTSDTEGGKPLEADDVSFIQTAGEQPHTDLAPFTEERNKAPLPLGEILVDGEIPESGYEEFGKWETSGLPGYVQSSRYAAALPDHYATWTPDIKEPGNYKVSFYNVCYINRADKAKIELFHCGGVETKIISQQGASGWIEFGTFPLKKGDYVKMTSVSESRNGSLAADTVKFEPEGTERLKRIVEHSSLFMTNYNRAFIGGILERMRKANPEIRALKLDGCIMVPVKFTAISFGASTFHMNTDTGAVDIFYKDYMIRFKIGEITMNVNTKDSAMEAPALLVEDCMYVPLSGIAQAFGKKLFLATNGLSVVADTDRGLQGIDAKAIEILSNLFT